MRSLVSPIVLGFGLAGCISGMWMNSPLVPPKDVLFCRSIMCELGIHQVEKSQQLLLVGHREAHE